MATDTQQPTLQETEGDDAGPRGRTLLQNALIAAIILVGPTLWQLTRIDDYGFGSLATGIAFVLLTPVVVVLGYSLLFRFPRGRRNLLYLMNAGVVGSTAFWITFAALIYIYLRYFDPSFKGNNYPDDLVGSAAAVIGATLVGSVVWRYFLGTGVRLVYELGSLLAAALGFAALTSLWSVSLFKLGPAAIWILVPSFAPLVIVAWRYAPRLSTKSLLLLLLVTAFPFYAAKAIDDAIEGAETPLLWPYRVIADYVLPIERQ